MSEAVDLIPLTKSVMFVGDYFSMITTVVLNEELREEGEDDEDLAIRLAGVLIQEFYGWDVVAVSKEIGLVEDDAAED
jgi:hypothetical protein